MNAYAPRRQSKRWLDGDCPRAILALYYDKREPSDQYTVFYAEPLCGTSPADMSLQYVGLSAAGMGYHGELKAYQTAEFRFRNAHRACKWTSLPKPVRDWILADIKKEHGHE